MLDSPELMWAEPSLEPVYTAVRSYLEMDQRVGLLTERLSVIGDLLAVLKDQVGTKHGEYLEWIGMFVFSSSSSSSSSSSHSWAFCVRGGTCEMIVVANFGGDSHRPYCGGDLGRGYQYRR